MLPRELISSQKIATRVRELAKEIDAGLPPGPVTVVGVLRGAFMFMADLVRELPREIVCDFLAVRSYGDATVSSGVVEITADLQTPIAGRHVLLVEDIVDTGLTMRYLLDFLRARGPASLHTCVMLRKRVAAAHSTPVDFLAFDDLPDQFLVGYGLDAAQIYRNLSYIGAIERQSA